MKKPYYNRRIKGLRKRVNSVSKSNQETAAKNSTRLESITKYTTPLRTLIIDIVVLSLIIITACDFILSMQESRIKIKAVSIPKSLENIGYNKESTAKRIRTEISMMFKANHASLNLPPLVEAGTEINIDILGSGMQYNDLIAYIKPHFGNPDILIDFDITKNDSRYLAHVRFLKEPPFPENGVSSEIAPDELLLETAKSIVRQLYPVHIALYELNQVEEEGCLLDGSCNYRTVSKELEHYFNKPSTDEYTAAAWLLKGYVTPSKNADDAILAFRKAIELKPDYAAAYNNMGISLNDIDKIDEAIIAFRKAIELRPDNEPAYNNLGNVLKKKNQFDEAIISYRKAIELEPNFTGAYFNLGGALNKNDQVDEAIVAYRKVIELEPNFTRAYYRLGNALKKNDQLGEAKVVFKKAEALDKNLR